MEVFYTGTLDCKDRYVDVLKYQFDRALQIVEVGRSSASPIIALRRSSHCDPEYLAFNRPLGLRSPEYLAKFKQSHVASTLVEVVLNRVQKAGEQRTPHLGLIDIDGIGDDSRIEATNAENLISLAGNKAERIG